MSGVLAVLTSTRTAAGGGGGGVFGVTASDIYSQVAAGTQASGFSSATPSGNTGSVTYSWSAVVTGVTFTGTATATLTGTKTGTATGLRSGTATVTATDAGSGSTATATIAVYLENI